MCVAVHPGPKNAPAEDDTIGYPAEYPPLPPQLSAICYSIERGFGFGGIGGLYYLQKNSFYYLNKFICFTLKVSFPQNW